MLEGLANRSAGHPRGLTEVRFDWMASLLRSRETSIRSTNDQQLTLSLHCFGLLLCNKSRLGFFIFYNCFIVVVFFLPSVVESLVFYAQKHFGNYKPYQKSKIQMSVMSSMILVACMIIIYQCRINVHAIYIIF